MADTLRASYVEPSMIEWRHVLHENPELGFEERLTAAFVAEKLRSFGLEIHEAVGKTGVVGVLRRGDATKTIGLRADMDALPISEVPGLQYASRRTGVMHACGHDGHMAMLLGAAKQLAQDGDFDGRVIFIFQPNEENGQGALAMLKDGLLDRFGVDQVFGMHNIPGMPLGTFSTRRGSITSSESLFEIDIEARGGHAALPHMGVDAITVGAEIVGALQTIVARKLDPSQNGVVSITEFTTNGRRNVLPGRAKLKGDTRAITPEINAIIEQKMRRIVAGICDAHEVSARVSYDVVFPATVNDPAAVELAVAAATKSAGRGAVNESCPPQLFSEDFAHFAAARSACFILMGNGLESRHAQSLHAADYDFCDEALVHGASFWVSLTEHALATFSQPSPSRTVHDETLV